MWRAIWQLAAHRTLTWYLPVFFLLAGYTLAAPHPLGIYLLAMLLGGLQGWVLAFRLFTDPPRVSPFIFSLPFSRSRLFFYRWLIGLLLQALTLATIFVIVASGLRQATQVSMCHSAWYPMVRWFELSVLWPVGLTSLLVYQATCFLILRRRLNGCRRISKLKWLGNKMFLGIALLLAILFFLAASCQELTTNPGIPVTVDNTGHSFVISSSYYVLLVVATTLASLYCSRHFDVDA